MALALAVGLEPERAAAHLEATGIPAGAATITLERTGPSGTAAGVRGAVGASVSGTTFIVRDYEAPLGVPLAYTATAYDAAGASVGTAADDFELPSSPFDDPWLVDLAFPTNSEQVLVESLRELEYEAPVGVHRVIDRRAPVLTSGLAFTPTADLVFVTADETARQRARAILGTGVPVLLRTDPEQGVGNIYLGVHGWTEERPSRYALHPDRRFRCQVVQVDRPDPSVFVPLAPMTYGEVKERFATYADLAAQTPNYDALAYQYSPTHVSPYLPWPPADV